MILATRVKLVLDTADRTPLPGVRVALYDRDESDPDNFLAEGTTDRNGEARLAFESMDYTDKEDMPLWRTDSLPDLYIVVLDAAGRQVVSSREWAKIDELPNLLTIPISPDLAKDHALI